jgi:heptosyltransferase-1
MHTILIIKTSAIGDLIQTFPVIDYLRRRFPNAKIDWVAEKNCAALAASHPYVDRVIPIETKKWRKNLWKHRSEIKTFLQDLKKVEYDLLFDLQGNSKSAFITFSARAKEKVGFAFHSVPEKPNLLATKKRYDAPLGINIRLRYLQIVQQHFNDRTDFLPRGVALKTSSAEGERLKEILHELPRPVYMVCFGSNWPNKKLGEKTLLNFLQQLSLPYFLFIYGNPDEEKVANELQAAFPGRSKAVGNLSLPLWQALMTRVDRVIAMDSAALHLCGTTDTPSFSVFGPSNSAVYKPLGPQHLSFQGPCPYNRVFVHRCPRLRTCPTGACMRDLAPTELLSVLNSSQ